MVLICGVRMVVSESHETLSSRLYWIHDDDDDDIPTKIEENYDIKVKKFDT